MSDEFAVEVIVTCDRTQKVHKISMSLEEAGRHKQNLADKVVTADEIKSFLGGIPHPKPDLVVMFRGEIVVHPTIIHKKDATVMRLLHDLTQSPAFPKPAVKPRKKTGKNGKRESSPPISSSTATAE